MKKLYLGLAMSMLLFACGKEDATLPVSKKSLAGTWMVEKYEEKVVHAEGASEEGALEFVVKDLTESKMVLATSESEAGETFTATATFNKVHPGVISFSDLIGKWAVGSESQIWEINKDGTCKETVSLFVLTYTNDYTIKLDTHKLILSNSTQTVVYDVLCFGKDDIQIMPEKGNEPIPLIRMKD